MIKVSALISLLKKNNSNFFTGVPDSVLKELSSSLQNKAQAELEKLDKDLNVKINDSADTIEKNKQKSLDQIQEQIHDITKLTLSKVVQFNISNDDIKKAVKSVEKSLN